MHDHDCINTKYHKLEKSVYNMGSYNNFVGTDMYMHSDF